MIENKKIPSDDLYIFECNAISKNSANWFSVI